MKLFCRKGDLIRLLVPTVSAWQGIGIAADKVYDDGDPDTVVPFFKQDHPLDDQVPSIALISEVELIRPTNREIDRLIWQSEQNPQGYRELVREFLARWGRPAIEPVPVSERLPESSVKVLAYYFNALGKGRTICAIWVPAKSRSDEGDLDSDDFLEYDEEGDKYYWPEGWYEAIENWDELGWAKVYEGEIVYWQPLPRWPANALPTPEAN